MMMTTYQRPLARTCIDCGAPLPDSRHGFYCAEHDREGDGTPHALVSVTWSSRGRYWAVVVERCPLCGRSTITAAAMVPSPRLAIGSHIATNTMGAMSWSRPRRHSRLGRCPTAASAPRAQSRSARASVLGARGVRREHPRHLPPLRSGV
jgi:hypothetical protein